MTLYEAWRAVITEARRELNLAAEFTVVPWLVLLCIIAALFMGVEP